VPGDASQKFNTFSQASWAILWCPNNSGFLNYFLSKFFWLNLFFWNFQKIFSKNFSKFFLSKSIQKNFFKGDRVIHSSSTTTSTNTCINSTTIFYK